MDLPTIASRSAENEPRAKGGLAGLVAILVAILLGVVVGVVFGRTLWMASGGPGRALQRLEETKRQKEEFARDQEQLAAQTEDAGQKQALQAEAVRLRGHVPAIEKEIADLGRLDQQALDGRGTRAHFLAEKTAELIKFAGDVFLQVLKLLVIPLVVTSMICGITALGDIRKVGRVGAWTVIYYMSTGAVAVLIGIVLVQIIRPGVEVDDTFAYVTENVAAKQDATVFETLLNVFRGSAEDPGSGMFPSNIFLAATKTNVLALIVFSIVFGGALTTIGDKGRVAIDFFKAANEAVMQMVHLVMIFAPVGIFGLVAANIIKNGGGAGLADQLGRLAWYVTTVLTGLSVHALFLGSLLYLIARRNPLVYTYNILRALLTAMSTASSSATLPITMECVEENNKVSNRSASFVLPLGATVNMDGTAFYEAVAVIFIAQSLGIEMGTGELVVVFLTATLAAVGAAGIPEAGLVTMVIVLSAVGLPMSGIGTILAIDWFLDRMRTTVNVYGDAVGAAVIDNFVQQETANQ